MSRGTRRPGAFRGERGGGHGFSLIELMVVIAIMTLVTTFGMRTLSNSSDLNAAVPAVSGMLNTARQIALTQNKYVQVRFYQQADQTDPRYGHYFAIGIYSSNSPYYLTTSQYATYQSYGWFQQEGRLYYLPRTVAILKSPQNSMLLDVLTSDAVNDRNGTGGSLAMQNCSWVAFYFNPQGAVDVPMDGAAPLAANKSYFSLCSVVQYRAAGNSLPSDYATILLDPVNGRTQIVRP